MSFEIPAGKWVRGFLASDTLNADTAIPLVDANGVAVTLGKGDRFVLEEALISNGATAAKYTLYCDADGGGTYTAGEELFVTLLAVNSPGFFPAAGNSVIFGRQSDGANKGKIRVIASAASVGSSLTLIGRIINS
jgi:hypothetical protein